MNTFCQARIHSGVLVQRVGHRRQWLKRIDRGLGSQTTVQKRIEPGIGAHIEKIFTELQRKAGKQVRQRLLVRGQSMLDNEINNVVVYAMILHAKGPRSISRDKGYRHLGHRSPPATTLPIQKEIRAIIIAPSAMMT